MAAPHVWERQELPLQGIPAGFQQSEQPNLLLGSKRSQDCGPAATTFCRGKKFQSQGAPAAKPPAGCHRAAGLSRHLHCGLEHPLYPIPTPHISHRRKSAKRHAGSNWVPLAHCLRESPGQLHCSGSEGLCVIPAGSTTTLSQPKTGPVADNCW